MNSCPTAGDDSNEAHPPRADRRVEPDRPLRRPRTAREFAVFPLWLGIRFYQRAIRPLLPPLCRHYPSCSRYAVEALHGHGVFRGSWLAFTRILRCNPLSKGGFDPVPRPPSPRTPPPRSGAS